MRLHPIIERALAPGAPLALRLATARGSVPVPRSALLPALVELVADPDSSVREAALTTLEGLGEDDLLEILSDAGSAGSVVDHIVHSRKLSGAPLFAALTHPEISESALCKIAASDSLEALDILVSNQEKLIASPAIAECLQINPFLSGDQRRRLDDFLEQFYRQGPAASAHAPAALEEEPEIVTEGDLQTLLKEVSDLPFLSMDLGDLLDSEGLNIDLEELIGTDAALESTWKRLMRMNGAQRLREALRGGREERTILIRDRNRIIACAVLKNPRISDQEIESIAAMKTVNEEILRFIGSSREWMRSVGIVRQLVRNPKTPPGVAMNHLNRLGLRDLQFLCRDHNVSDIIRRTARRQLELREHRPGQAQGRH